MVSNNPHLYDRQWLPGMSHLALYLALHSTHCVLLQVQFRVCPQFLHKPPFQSSEFHGPTISDITRPPSLHIAPIPPSHSLDLNAYPILRPSYLLTTDSPIHRQSSPLDVSDIQAAWKALNHVESISSGDRYIVIYNCGKEGGCSRTHKHMQLFPCPEDFMLFPDRSSEENFKVPYVYEIFRADRGLSGAEVTSALFKYYVSGLQRARELLGIGEGEHVPHNVVLVREWMLVIPRRKAGLGGVSANAAGMMGLVFVGSEEEMEEWKRRGPLSVLSELGVAKEKTFA